MSWANGFIGIPFADLGRNRTGCDCWGLACLVYRERLGITLPSFTEDYTSTSEAAEIATLLDQNKAPHWTQITQDVMPFDLLLFRRGRHDSHIGIALDANLMLHMASGDHAKVESYRSSRWNTRFAGAFRHHLCPLKGVFK